MTFMTVAQARAQCAPDLALYEAALDNVGDAWQDLQDAKDALDDARSALDGSTFATGAGLATIIGACLLPEPFSKSVCIGGILAGGLTVTGSEVDRQSDISSAEAGVAAAQTAYDNAVIQQELAWDKWFYGCVIHHMSKG